jgi:hypothetical protein
MDREDEAIRVSGMTVARLGRRGPLGKCFASSVAGNVTCDPSCVPSQLCKSSEDTSSSTLVSIGYGVSSVLRQSNGYSNLLTTSVDP